MRFPLQVLRWIRYLQYLIFALIFNNIDGEKSGDIHIKTTDKENEISIHCHIFHTYLAVDLLKEISKFRESTALSSQIFVTTSPEKSEAVKEICKLLIPEAQILIYPNQGRDILPFLQLAQSGKLSQSHLILKIHTKADRKVNTGHFLNDAIAHELLDERSVQALFELSKEYDFVSTTSKYILGYNNLGKNLKPLKKLVRLTKLRRVPLDLKFPAASCFWITDNLVNRIGSLDIDVAAFPFEPIPPDGTIAHAFERYYGMLAISEGLGVLPLESFVESENFNAN